MSVYPSLFLGAVIVGILSLPLSAVMLRLRGGEARHRHVGHVELAHLLVNLDTLVRGETGTSLIELNTYSIETRREATYWSALASMTLLLALVFWLLRSPLGAAIRAIRDNEEAAKSIGVRVTSAKRLVFVLAAFGAALAGALWIATALTFQPKAYLSPLWTAYMIFMALVGGLGTFEGAGRFSARSCSSASKRGSVRQAFGISWGLGRRRSCSRSLFRAAYGAGSRTTRR